MRGRPLRAAAVLCVPALVSACATYRADPLPKDAPPTPPAATLVERAGRLSHPYLTPVAIDLGQPLSPQELGVLAVVASPALKAARARAGVSEAQVFEAGLLPDPQLSLGFDRPLSAPGAVNAIAAALGFDVSALYRLGPARDAARAQARQARLDVAWQEWQTAFQARLLAARIAGLSRAVRLSQGSRAVAEQVLDRTLRAVARGDLNSNDLEARRIAAADAADRARAAERDLSAARLELNKLLGLPPATELDIVLPAYVDRPSPAHDELFALAREARLDLQALRAGYAAQEAGLRGAVLAQYPKLNLTVNAARDTGNVRTLGPAVAFDLPVFNRNQGAIAVARATRAQLKAEYDLRLFETRADLAALVKAYEIGRRQRADLVGQLGPLRGLVAGFERAAARGDVADVVADTARQSLTDKEIALAALDQSLAEQWSSIELATGRLLGSRP